MWRFPSRISHFSTENRCLAAPSTRKVIETLGARATFQSGARLTNREVTMQRHSWMLILAIGVAGCGGGGGATSKPTGPTCKPIAATEATCSGGVDDDCDGYSTASTPSATGSRAATA